ncbi:MAG: ribonuclease P protein subunit [Candidatus Caldarchaeum sp.]
MSLSKEVAYLLIHGWRVEASYNGMLFSGVVVDESRSTITIRTDKGVKTLPKKEAVFRFNPGEPHEVKIDGSRLFGRPIERLLRERRR